jgi:hypothetical protein
MCVFLLLSGQTRYVPEAAHVRVHQIWMGDRADDAKAASYTAQDMMIVERDIGRLAKYTFDMGGAGDLLSLSLNVPPWEDLHELSREELRLTNLVTTDMVAQPGSPNAAVVELPPKPVQDRFVSSAVATQTNPEPTKSTKTTEAMGLTGGVRAPAWARVAGSRLWELLSASQKNQQGETAYSPRFSKWVKNVDFAVSAACPLSLR